MQDGEGCATCQGRPPETGGKGSGEEERKEMDRGRGSCERMQGRGRSHWVIEEWDLFRQ